MSHETHTVGEIEEYTVCTGGGLSPRLNRLQTGELAVIVRDIPNHATALGGLDLYVSHDEGIHWIKRSDLPDFRPDKGCGGGAFGVLTDGTLVTTLSEFDHRTKPREFHQYSTRSTDGGRTWEGIQPLDIMPEGMDRVVPWGRIVQQSNGTALLCFYAWRNGEEQTKSIAYILRSTDSGRSWRDYSPIAADDYNETALLLLDDDHIVAVMRNLPENGVYGTGEALFQIHSADGGRSWCGPKRLTLDQQHPADLVRLRDGSLLLTYGNRIDGNRVVEANLAEGEHIADGETTKSRNGVRAMVSSDNGRTWGPDGGLALYEGCISDDCGYPSSVQLDDGTIVTVFYEEFVRREDFRAVALRYKLAST